MDVFSRRACALHLRSHHASAKFLSLFESLNVEVLISFTLIWRYLASILLCRRGLEEKGDVLQGSSTRRKSQGTDIQLDTVAGTTQQASPRSLLQRRYFSTLQPIASSSHIFTWHIMSCIQHSWLLTHALGVAEVGSATLSTTLRNEHYCYKNTILMLPLAGWLTLHVAESGHI